MHAMQLYSLHCNSYVLLQSFSIASRQVLQEYESTQFCQSLSKQLGIINTCIFRNSSIKLTAVLALLLLSSSLCIVVGLQHQPFCTQKIGTNRLKYCFVQHSGLICDVKPISDLHQLHENPMLININIALEIVK